MTKSMDDIIAEMTAKRQLAADDAEEERKALAIRMFALGVRHVLISFNGGGDSGQIDDITIKMVDYKTVPEGLQEEIESWADRFLEGTGVDWYNDDGGFGEIEFDMPMWPGRFRAEVSQYETTSSVQFSIEDAA